MLRNSSVIHESTAQVKPFGIDSIFDFDIQICKRLSLFLTSKTRFVPGTELTSQMSRDLPNLNIYVCMYIYIYVCVCVYLGGRPALSAACSASLNVYSLAE